VFQTVSGDIKQPSRHFWHFRDTQFQDHAVKVFHIVYIIYQINSDSECSSFATCWRHLASGCTRAMFNYSLRSCHFHS